MNRLAVALVASSLAWLSSGTASADDGSNTLDWVWRTVNQNFYTEQFNGVDWNAMQTKYRDRANRATTREERAVVINEMLAELHTSHTAFYTPDTPEYYHLLGLFLPMNEWLAKATASALIDGKASYSGIGIFTQTVNGQQFVRGVHDGLPTHEAGIQLGDRLVSVDGAPFHPIRSFQGKAGQSVTIVVERAPGVSKTVTVVPAMLDGSKMFVDAMQASTQVVARDGRNIGYIHAWSYAGQQYQDTLEGALLFGALKDADARGRLGSIVGAPTAGAVMAGTIFANEADASLLYLATKDVRMDDGTRIEGQGVQPDIDVPFQLPYAQGHDARRERALDEAVRLSRRVDALSRPRARSRAARVLAGRA